MFAGVVQLYCLGHEILYILTDNRVIWHRIYGKVQAEIYVFPKLNLSSFLDGIW